MFRKGAERGLVNFALFHELAAVNRLQARYRALLAEGEGSAWAAVTRAALESLGGTADLQRLYREIEGHRPTTNTFWQAKVRQTVQRIAIRVDDGVWALPAEA
jgi:site-specific DNA-methyltransferase (adenine-specific)